MAPSPDILRGAYLELIVSGLAASSAFYVDVLDLEGNPQPVVARTDDSELAVTIGADGFSYTREGDEEQGFKLGHTL